MGIRDTFLGNVYYTLLNHTAISLIKKTNLHPKQITLIGGIVALFVPFAFYISPLFGCIFILISGILDSTDGYLAREKELDSLYGGFLDSTIDRISDFFYLLGFWILSLKFNYYLLFGILFFTGLTLTFLFSYTKARIEGLGGYCNVGLMERAIRTIFLLLWGLFLWLSLNFWTIFLGIFIYNILMLLSTIQRIKWAKQVLLK